jgi:hypothetical protein
MKIVGFSTTPGEYEAVCATSTALWNVKAAGPCQPYHHTHDHPANYYSLRVASAKNVTLR